MEGTISRSKVKTGYPFQTSQIVEHASQSPPEDAILSTEDAYSTKGLTHAHCIQRNFKQNHVRLEKRIEMMAKDSEADFIIVSGEQILNAFPKMKDHKDIEMSLYGTQRKLSGSTE